MRENVERSLKEPAIESEISARITAIHRHTKEIPPKLFSNDGREDK